MYHLRKLYQDFNSSDLDAVRIVSLFTSMPNIKYQECVSPSQVKNYVNRMEKEGVARVKMLSIVTGFYLIFWGPLFIVTVWNWNWSWAQAKDSIAHEVSLHISYCHSIVTPLLYLVLHPGLRRAAPDMTCCSQSGTQTRQQDGSTGKQHSQGSTENR